MGRFGRAWMGLFVALAACEQAGSESDAPSWPDGAELEVSLEAGGVQVSWPEARFAEAGGTYRVRADGVVVAQVAPPQGQVVVAPPDQVLEMGVAVTAVAANGRASAALEAVVALADTVAPMWPDGADLAFVPTEGAVQLHWPQAWDAVGVADYRVKVGDAAEQAVTGTSLEVSQPGASVRVVAVDAAGNRSAALNGTLPGGAVGGWPEDATLVLDASVAGQVVVGWPDAGAEVYELLVDGVGGAQTAGTAWTVAGLQAATTVQLVVRGQWSGQWVLGPSASLEVPDLEAPTWPEDAAAWVSESGGQLALGWTAAQDDAAGGLSYDVRQGEVLLGQTEALWLALESWEAGVPLQVWARDAGGHEAAGPKVAPPKLDGAKAPEWTEGAALEATTVEPTRVQLSWSGADPSAVRYRVYRDEAQVLLTDGPQTTAWVEELAPWTTYAFRVEAESADGLVSTGGPDAKVHTADWEAPDWVPGSVLVAEPVDGDVVLSWALAVDGDSGVQTYHVTFGDQSWSGAETTWTVPDVPVQSAYDAVVQAEDAAGNVTDDGPSTALWMPDTTAPVWPAGAALEVTNMGEGIAELSWPAATDDHGVDHYLVGEAGDPKVQVTWLSQAFGPLPPLDPKLFEVQAVDAAGNVSAPLQVGFTPPDWTLPLWGEPQPLMLGALGPSSIQLSWLAAFDEVGITGYQVWQDGVAGPVVTGTTATISGLSPETTYAFWVVATDAAGNWSEPSNTLEVTTPSAIWTDETVFQLLAPSCEGCHTQGSRPFFASFDAFMNGLAYDAKWVTPGDGAGSELIALLQGTSTVSAYGQMPPGEHSFADLEAMGETLLGIDDLITWIDGLSPPELDDQPPTDLPLVRRLPAEAIVKGLYDLLGLDDNDFWTGPGLCFGHYLAISYGFTWTYPVRSPDAPPGWCTNSNVRAPSHQRWAALGGPDFGGQRARSQEVSPVFVQTLTQMAQAHCRMAVEDQNPEVLGDVSLSQGSASHEAAIRAQIANLHLRFLSEPATDAQVDTLFADVFVPHEAEANTTAGWTAVCATLLRSPEWILY